MQTFYSAWVTNESMQGGGMGVEVRGLRVSVELDLTPPAISLSRGTGLRVQWSSAGRRSLSTHKVPDLIHRRTVSFAELQTCTTSF